MSIRHLDDLGNSLKNCALTSFMQSGGIPRSYDTVAQASVRVALTLLRGMAGSIQSVFNVRSAPSGLSVKSGSRPTFLTPSERPAPNRIFFLKGVFDPIHVQSLKNESRAKRETAENQTDESNFRADSPYFFRAGQLASNIFANQ